VNLASGVLADRALRSLHVVTSTQRRGAETFAFHLAAALRNRGAPADVIALSGSVGDPWTTLPIRALGTRSRSASTYAALRSLAHRYDIVIGHGSSTLEACAIALAGSGIPLIYTSIGDSSYWVRTFKQRALTRLLLRRCAGIVTLWPEAANYMRDRYGISGDRLHVIPNGADTERFPFATLVQRQAARGAARIPPTATSLVYVGALSDEKNVGAAIDAASQMPHAYLAIAGDGPGRRTLENAAVAVAPGRVRFLGSVDDVSTVYMSADLLLLPSKSEGMPMVIIEAGMMGTATVATRVGAIPSMIEDGVTGYLSEAGDNRAFSRTVERAVKTSALVGRTASQSFRRRFDLATCAQAWIHAMSRTYDAAVPNPSSGRQPT
jgi:glycosyltransferase involved in cell wall biosynthesis